LEAWADAKTRLSKLLDLVQDGETGAPAPWDTEPIRIGEPLMKTIEAVGTIEQERRVLLDHPLPPGVVGRVRVLILVGDDDMSEPNWMRAAAEGGGFEFLKAAGEDIYTLEDGKPFDDAR
jgi:hypothetical protein